MVPSALPPGVPAARCVRARRAAALGALPAARPRGAVAAPSLRRSPHRRPSRRAGARRGRHAEVLVIDGRTLTQPAAHAHAGARGDAGVPSSRSRSSSGTSSCRRRTASARRRISRGCVGATPHAVAFCHQSPWHVPIRWFVLFRDDERELGEDEHGPLAAALPDHDAPGDPPCRAGDRPAAPQRPRPDRRPDRRPAPVDGAVRSDRRSSSSTTRRCATSSGGTSSTTTTRPARSHDALEALESGEYPRAADVYQGVLTRWAEVRSREILN